MDLLLDKNELIWAAGLSLALVYFVATYVRLRYCERHVTEYGRLILQTYGRDMHVVPESVLRYYRQDVGAYRSARRWYPFAFLRSGAGLLSVPAVVRASGVGFPKRRRPVFGRIVHPAAGLKCYCYAWSMRFNEASGDELRYEKDLDRLHRDEYLRMLNEK